MLSRARNIAVAAGPGLPVADTWLRYQSQVAVVVLAYNEDFHTEGRSLLKWSNMDGISVLSVQKQYRHIPLVTYPNQMLTIIGRVPHPREDRLFSILAGVHTWRKGDQRDVSDQRIHHFESPYIRLVIHDLLWKIFRIGKRKVQLSATVRSGKIMPTTALEILKIPLQTDAEITQIMKEIRDLLSSLWKIIRDYPNSYPRIRARKWLIKHEKYLEART